MTHATTLALTMAEPLHHMAPFYTEAVATQTDTLLDALTCLRETVGCRRVDLYTLAVDAAGEYVATFVTGAAALGLSTTAALTRLPACLFTPAILAALGQQQLVGGLVERLLEGAPADVKRLQKAGIVGLHLMPITIHGRLCGVLSLSDCLPGTAWRPEHLRLLRTTSSLLAVILQQSELISRLQEREQALEAARDAALATAQARAGFLANMSHEIRTPLNAVIGMAGLLLTTELSPEQQGCAEIIMTGCRALLAVINDVLDLSRLEAGHTTITLEPFDLQLCLETTLDLVALEAQQKGLALTYRCDPQVPTEIVGDEHRLRQVLLNLLSNALKFTSQGEVALEVTTTAEADTGAWLKITVRDTGIGMSPEQLTRIFEPFVQAEPTTARRYGGTGLGLAICRKLVTQMGGQIEVQSTPDCGSTFEITLPLLSTLSLALGDSETDLAHPDQQLRVLIAEDNLISQEVMRLLVQQLGHTPTVVPNGQAALEALSRQFYDIVMIDAQLPQFDGEAVTRQIRALQPSIAQPYIIALMGEVLPNAHQLSQVGIDDYLVKPIEPGRLRQVLAQYRASQQPYSTEQHT